MDPPDPGRQASRPGRRPDRPRYGSGAPCYEAGSTPPDQAGSCDSTAPPSVRRSGQGRGEACGPVPRERPQRVPRCRDGRRGLRSRRSREDRPGRGKAGHPRAARDLPGRRAWNPSFERRPHRARRSHKPCGRRDPGPRHPVRRRMRGNPGRLRRGRIPRRGQGRSPRGTSRDRRQHGRGLRRSDSDDCSGLRARGRAADAARLGRRGTGAAGVGERGLSARRRTGAEVRRPRHRPRPHGTHVHGNGSTADRPRDDPRRARVSEGQAAARCVGIPVRGSDKRSTPRPRGPTRRTRLSPRGPLEAVPRIPRPHRPNAAGRLRRNPEGDGRTPGDHPPHRSSAPRVPAAVRDLARPGDEAENRARGPRGVRPCRNRRGGPGAPRGGPEGRRLGCCPRDPGAFAAQGASP